MGGMRKTTKKKQLMMRKKGQKSFGKAKLVAHSCFAVNTPLPCPPKATPRLIQSSPW